MYDYLAVIRRNNANNIRLVTGKSTSCGNSASYSSSTYSTTHPNFVSIRSNSSESSSSRYSSYGQSWTYDKGVCYSLSG